MSSTLGPLAICQILAFTEQDSRRGSTHLSTAARVPKIRLLARHVSYNWARISELYFVEEPARSLDCFRSPELLLRLKEVLGCGDARVLFAHGKPIVFGPDIPQLLVSKVVQAFLSLREKPSSLDVTVNLPCAPTNHGRWGPSCKSALRELARKCLADMWPEVYVSHLPCTQCTTIRPRSGRRNEERLPCVIEKFHVSSKHFDTKLTVELSFALDKPENYGDDGFPVRTATGRKIEKVELRHVLIHLDDEVCGRNPGVITRNSQSLLLVPDLASEVYSFLERVHIGASLTANGSLSMLILKLKSRLPKHQLMCEFEGKTSETGLDSPLFTGSYWVTVRHLRPDLKYTDVRHIHIPGEEGFAADRALLVAYLSNSHVADLKAPYWHCRFSLKMLAALMMHHNVSVSRLQMGALDNQFTDYRSLNVVFGGETRLNALHLWICSEGLANLIKTTDFLRIPAIQELTELRLSVKFGEGKGTQHPKHFKLTVSHLHRSERRRPERVFPFDERHRVSASQSLRCGGPGAGKVTWEVYRFRNPAMLKWLTACVGHRSGRLGDFSVLHIAKGKARALVKRGTDNL